ncbi:integrase arm-type DNA-binding domain-containing protein [Pseudomonas sp. S31]|uniref:tyrosine-type recombinase/integrase n=1 Tax=Pseudomonas sp. S31 TaxID=1564473 RepID=UPI0019146898|nr:integrase arm-type DNA-binding domain-containing protein [Pseudomonas sp. S31]MBK4999557.1 integrase arm-type DNA-binding domain-containing protein [Pseudomonas sp. S31]
MPLTALQIKASKPTDKQYMLGDSSGLGLLVHPNGSKYWHFRYTYRGRAMKMSLGVWPVVSLQEARDKAAECRRLVKIDINPGAKARADKREKREAGLNTFKRAAEYWYQFKADSGRAQATLKKIRDYLDKDLLPALGSKQLEEITRADCARLQASIEKRGAFNVADKARTWLKQIFSQAIARGLCEHNPASELHTIALAPPPTLHYPHLHENELPEFLQALSRTTSRLPARVAAWMAILTAARPGMVRYAAWEDIDFEEGTWTVPAERMKMRRDYVTPLPHQLIAKLVELHRLTGRSRYLFPGNGNKRAVLCENTINLVFVKIGYQGRLVSHGVRHTASTLLREHGWLKDHVESQLAHVEGGIAGEYNQALYMTQRRIMMQWYADYLDALREGMTPDLRDQLDARVNQFLSHKATVLLGNNATSFGHNGMEGQRGALQR